MADTISTLPDAILCHILSFLPTKQVVPTSVLSKRWNPLWRSIPTLDFDDFGYTDATYSRFVQSVNTLVVSRHFNQPIQTFRLRCGSQSLCAPNNVNAWVNAAAQLRVEHLDLSMPFMNPKMDLPSVVLSCRTLVVLKLERLSVKAFSSVDFPLLKILHLKGTSFLDHRHLAEFLSACPNLVDFVVKYLYFDNHSSEAEFESLPKLVRADIVRYDLPLKAVSNVEFLRAYWVDLEALAPGEISVALYPCHKELIPMFQNLTNIELIYIDYNIGYLLRLVEMLKHCPKLQKLAIDKENLYYFTGIYDCEDWPYNPQPVPECLSLHLQTCILKNYMGSKGEFRFARYIMRYARLLQTMTIHSSYDLYLNRQEKFRMIKKLSRCTRSSAACRLSFK